jgi:hypothetical protein
MGREKNNASIKAGSTEAENLLNLGGKTSKLILVTREQGMFYFSLLTLF